MVSLSTAPVQRASVVGIRLRARAFKVALAAVTLLALALRLWSIDFGLPLVTHPDEPQIVDAAQRMLDGRTTNPGWYHYPALIIELEAGVLLAGDALDLDTDAEQTFDYAAGRTLMTAFGVATVVLTGLLGRQLLSAALLADASADLAGLVAAALLATSFLHVKDSHYLKPDVPAAAFTTLTVLLTLRAWQRRDLSARAWLWPGLAAGLAAATKYNAGAVIVVPAAGLLLAAWRDRPRDARAAISLALLPLVTAAAAALAFVALNPSILLNRSAFFSPVDGMRSEWLHYRSGHDGAEGSDTWRWYLLEVWRSGFGPATLLVIVGILALLAWLLPRRQVGSAASRTIAPRREVALLVLVFPLCYYALIAPFPVRFDRQLMPALPYLAALGGCGAASIAGRLRRGIEHLRLARPPRHAWAGVVATLVLVGLLILPGVHRATGWDAQIGRPDSRYAALSWIRANVPTNLRVAHEWYTPPLAQAGYDDVPVRALEDHPLEWYQAARAELLVTSSFMYQRYLDDPARYPNEAAFYTALLAQPRLATFLGDNGPQIVILRRDDAAPAFSLLDAAR